MPALKPAYLIHGDDHGRIGERRARLRALAEAEGGSLEVAATTPQASSGLLSALTLSIGRRFIIIDGVEGWKDAEVAEHLVPVLAAMPPDTTVAFFAREDGRAKAPAALHAAVKAAGGDVSAELAVKEWDLPRWVVARAAELELTLDAAAARALVGAIGARQARLAREIEKLALECDPGARLDAEAVLERVARSAERKAWTLADALVARDRAAATRVYLQLRAQGERIASSASGRCAPRPGRVRQSGRRRSARVARVAHRHSRHRVADRWRAVPGLRSEAAALHRPAARGSSGQRPPSAAAQRPAAQVAPPQARRPAPRPGARSPRARRQSPVRRGNRPPGWK